MMAVAGLFASCQSNLEPVVVDEVVNVSLEVGTPEVATRAYSDGTKATKLQYAVYDAEGKKLDVFTETNGKIEGTAKVDLQLTTGNTYNVLFWASAPDAPYTVDLGAKTMTVDYSKVLLSNDENLDAFYKWETIKVTGPMSKTVELKRPFAQLNVGTNDFEEAAATGYEPVKSYVKVTSIFNTLYLSNGEVSGADAVEFALNKIPSGETFPVNGYEYLAMNYLLVASDKEVVDVEFGYKANGEAEPRVRTVGSVPVQRNHRTNLYGQLLTSDVEINVEILPGFDDEYNNEHLYYYENGVYYIASAEGLAYVAQQVNAGNEDWTSANISLKADIDLAAVNTRSTSNWTPIGTEDYVFEGVFDGKGHTIKNLNLVYTEPSYFIGFFGTAENATIKNVTFENVYVNVASDDTNSGGHIAAVAGYADNTLFENITVKGDVKVESTFESNASSRVAVVLGGNLGKTVKMKNVHVKAEAGSYLKANNNVGSLAGQLLGTAVIEDCSSNIDVTAYKFFAGGIVGNTADKSTIKNCSYSGNAAVTNGRAGNINDLYRVGAIAGGWDDNVYTPFVLEGCTSTGTVSGKDAAGKVAVNFDCMGLVGRGYSAVAGAVVIIDGVKFTYAGGGKYDVVDANGNPLYYVGGTETAPQSLEDTFADLNANPEKNPVIKVAAGSYVEWTTGAGHGSTPFVGTDNSVTETVTIQGAEGSVLVVKGDGVGQLRAANGAKLIFKDITVVDESESYDEGAWELTYLEFSGNLEFNNVTFQGGIQLDSASGASPLNATFTKCTFVTNEDSVYAVWVCDGVSTFSNCRFQGTRGLKMHEAYGSEVKEVMIDACEFGPLSKKPGVAIGTVNADTKVTIQNSSFIGCQAGEQNKYIYETDTDVKTFTFVLNNNNVEADPASIVKIATKADLIAFQKEVNENGNGFSGKTIQLTADIDLEGMTWEPVGQTGGNGVKTYFQGSFDGKGYTISNFVVTPNATYGEGANYASGLFGFIDAGSAVVKNLNVDNATVNGHHWTAVIAGYLTGTIQNCHVTNSSVTCTHANNDACGDKAGVIVGYINSGSVKDCSATDCTVVAGRDAGQIVGCNSKNGVVSNCTATNVTVSAAGDCTGANVRNELIGRQN